MTDHDHLAMGQPFFDDTTLERQGVPAVRADRHREALTFFLAVLVLFGLVVLREATLEYAEPWPPSVGDSNAR